jgi:hypothetical protein
MSIVMSEKIISSDVVATVLQALEGSLALEKKAISCEIQEDFKHLLIAIDIGDLRESQRVLDCRSVGKIVDQLVPSRHGAYSWMVVFKRYGAVIDSCFGGDADSPNSGM